MDQSNFLESLIADNKIRYCVIGGQGVNAYAEPLVSLDLGLVVAVDQMESVEKLLGSRFHLERFPHSLNVSEAHSQLRVQIQTDPGLFRFPITLARAASSRRAASCRRDRRRPDQQDLGPPRS
jgi:hypothetical protein